MGTKCKSKSKWNPYTHITDMVIEGLENGVGPWSRPWTIKPGDAGLHMGLSPFNPLTKSGGRTYNGANTWLLAIRSLKYGWKDPRFCTFKQLAAKGWKVKEGQSGAKKVGGPGPSQVFFTFPETQPELDPVTKEPIRDSNGKVKTRTWWKIQIYRVWNYEQLDGPEAWVDEEHAPEDVETTETGERQHVKAWEVIEAWRQVVTTSFGGGKAYYRPGTDSIKLPELDRFDSEEDALSTEFHEQVHSTGHKSRLDRFKDSDGGFGSASYAFEELVAELGAANLMAATGVVSTGNIREDHVQYIQGWIKVLKKDNKALSKASGLAAKATTAILENYESVSTVRENAEKAA